MSDDDPYSDILCDVPSIGITGKKEASGYFITKEKILERDAQMREEGAKAERERVLEELTHHIANIQLNYGELSNFYLNNIRDKIDSLRSKEREGG